MSAWRRGRGSEMRPSRRTTPSFSTPARPGRRRALVTVASLARAPAGKAHTISAHHGWQSRQGLFGRPIPTDRGTFPGRDECAVQRERRRGAT
jgi:hypothetical protein